MAIFPAVCLIALVIIAGSALASCTGGGGKVGEYVPLWAGGLPNNAPPRPGTPEYDAFRKDWEVEAARDKSKDPPKAKTDPESVTPSTTLASPQAR
jgi:hypothetical protein